MKNEDERTKAEGSGLKERKLMVEIREELWGWVAFSFFGHGVLTGLGSRDLLPFFVGLSICVAMIVGPEWAKQKESDAVESVPTGKDES